MPFTVIGSGRWLLPLTCFPLGMLAGLIVSDLTAADIPAFVAGLAFVIAGHFTFRHCDRTEYGSEAVKYRQVIKRVQVDTSELQELVLLGGAGKSGRSVVGYTKTGRRVQLGPAGGKVVPDQAGLFENAVVEWAAARSVTVTNKLSDRWS